uniref:Zinc finger protein 827 n=1 Tax=Cynoglossus semilaevis TaxID=244447 RepID=A0A3P8UDV5_CYNSE
MRLYVDSNEEGGPDERPVEEETWFGNASDTRSESSSYGDTQDEVLMAMGSSPDERLGVSTGSGDHETCGGENLLGCSTPVHRVSLELLGLEGSTFSAQDTLSSVVSSLYGDAASRALGKPLSSNLRRLLEAGSRKLDAGDLLGRSPSGGTGGDSPPIGLVPPLTLSPSSHHAHQLSALARKVANNSGISEKWPRASCTTPCSSSLSPDSAIQKLKAAANAVLQDKNAAATTSSSSSNSTSSTSASSTLAALSKKVSERSQASSTASAATDHQTSASSFLSLVSMTSSAALLKEVAARAAGNMLAEKKDGSPLAVATVLQEDVKPLLDKNQKTSTPSTPTQSLELLLPSTPKARGKPNSSPEDGGKPFQCPVCGLVIKRKSYWKRHMVIHTGLKSHQCPLCPFRCARKDNLKSHMKVHQHQDRGETFQCELCPFTSSRHFSLKLHMRCHQHFPRTDVKVKEELTTDTEGEGSVMGDSSSTDLRGPEVSPLHSDIQQQMSPAVETPSNHVYIKEEPLERDLSVLSPFSICRDRPSSSANSLDLSGIGVGAGVRSSPSGPTTASLFSPDITTKTATDLLMKLSAENNKDTQYQPVTVKAEPMEVDPPPAELTPPAPHLLAFSTLGACEKSEPKGSLPETLACPQKDLFSQDISVKMASELLFKLSGKFLLKKQSITCFRQSPFNSCSKSSSPAEATSSTRTKDDVEPGNGIAQWRLNEQLFPCPVCGKVFGRQQTLSRHLALHTEERKYKCHLCPYAAKCKANLNQHLTIHSVKLVNTDTEQIVSAVTADSTECKNCPYYYSCHVCGFQTELNAQFVSHMSLHVDKEQWMFSLCCSVCDYVCMEENDMKNHISSGHAGTVSSLTSSSLSALSDSLNSSEGGDIGHSNEELKNMLAPPSSTGSQSSSGSFECVFCNFVCKTRSMYERHLQIHLITRKQVQTAVPNSPDRNPRPTPSPIKPHQFKPLHIHIYW